MKAKALKTLLQNADPIAYGLGMSAKDLVKYWVNNPKAISGLIEEYESDYNIMLADFGEDDKDVIAYKAVIDFLKSLKAAKSENPVLLSSSSTLEGVEKQIKDYYFGSEKLITKVSETAWSITGKSGLHSNVRVIRERNRYRFEKVS